MTRPDSDHNSSKPCRPLQSNQYKRLTNSAGKAQFTIMSRTLESESDGETETYTRYNGPSYEIGFLTQPL